MKTVKIGFVDFWYSFNPATHRVVQKICELADVDIEVIDANDPKRKGEIQYLFCSCFYEKYLDFDCIRIFYTGENIVPDFNSYDYCIGFSNITFDDRYLQYSNLYLRNLAKEIEQRPPVDIRGKEKFCAVVTSNPTCQQNFRNDFFFELSKKYKQVDSGGRYMNNVGMPQGVPDKREFLSHYKFSFAFENVSYPGYCTEKIGDSFAAGTVPIYWGDPDVETYFNKDAFINCMKYQSTDEIIQAIAEIDNDDEKYMKMANAPILREGYTQEEADRRLGEFLNHIFDQEYQQAFRRNRYHLGAKYECEKKLKANCYAKIKKKSKMPMATKLHYLKLSLKKIIKHHE